MNKDLSIRSEGLMIGIFECKTLWELLLVIYGIDSDFDLIT